MTRTAMRTLIEVAKDLAAAHRQADPSTTTIKFFPANGTQEIRLLEVSSAAPATGEVLPFRFASDRKRRVDYPSVVILLNPAEWRRVVKKKLGLPPGWDLAAAEDL